MSGWKRLERRGGQRADQHIVTVAAYAHTNRNRPPQVNMLIGAQIVRELQWKPGPLDIEAAPERHLLRLRPSEGPGSVVATQKQDAGTFTFCLPVPGKVEPHPTAPCEPWVVGDWLVLQIPEWLSASMGDEPRTPLRRVKSEDEIPAGQHGAGDDSPPVLQAPKVETGVVRSGQETAREADQKEDAPPTAAKEAVAGASAATPPKAAPPPPVPTPAAKVEPPAPKPQAPAIEPGKGPPPLGHHPERAVALRKLWPLATVRTTAIRENINGIVKDVHRFQSNAALIEYAMWLGLGRQGTPEKATANTAMAEAQRVPVGHSAQRERALRGGWRMLHIGLENLRQIVNQKSPDLPRFDLKALQAYAEWLGLGDRSPPAPVSKPASIAARAEIPAKSKERLEAEEEFAAGKSVREVADDFGLKIGTVSMWHYEWQQAKAQAKAAGVAP